MHILIVSTFFPYPQNCGKARVLGGLCSFLTDHPKVTRVSYFHIARAPAADLGLLDGSYQHAPGPGFAEVCRNLAATGMAGRRPALQEAFTFCRATQQRLWSFIRDQRPDVVVADTIRAGQYLESQHRPPSRYLLYLDDLFSLRYDRILKLMETNPEGAGSPLGNFGSFIPKCLRPLAERPASLKLLLGYERKAVQQREDEVVRRFDRSFLISPEEVEILRDRTGSESVYSLKLLTEARTEEYLCDGESPYFVFLGDLQLPHNRMAIENLVNDGAALMERDLPGYRVLIVGKSAPPELVAACRRTRNFKITGYVPDLQSLLLRARGLIAPLMFGSGVKIKCLEALRLGVPLVSSRIGVEGLSIRPEVEYLHAGDALAFICQMRRLTNDAEHARLSAAGHAWFENNYARSRVWREYEQLLLEEMEPDLTPEREAIAA